MKRSNSIIESELRPKKIKLSKEEKKQISKEKRKIRQYEIKKNSLIKDYYTESCEYYSENGLRKVRPYYFTFRSSIKSRWINKTVQEVFIHEFYADEPEYLMKRIEKGYLLINSEPTSPDYRLQPSDTIEHRIHRHELPVLDEPITSVHEDADVLVVSKPSSIPIHSVSKYHFNTVQAILAREHGLEQLRVVHRIDRMTSGVLILAKHYEAAVRLSSEIRDRLVAKFYVAAVPGRFEPAGPTECAMPLAVLCPRLGLMHAVTPGDGDGAKDASTRFTLVRYDERSDRSLVLCKPLTGRTHQIRVHLQYLGYPIDNDPLYNSSAWGPELGRHGEYHKSREALIADLHANHNIAFHQSLETGRQIAPSTEQSTPVSTVTDGHFDADCDECAANRAYNIEPASLVLHLHAYRYRAADGSWDYRAPLPNWARELLADTDSTEASLDRLTAGGTGF